MLLDPNIDNYFSGMNSNTSEVPQYSVNNASVMLTSEDTILGPAVVWTYLIIRAIQGSLAILGNGMTIGVVYWFEALWERSTCRIVASLALADLFGGIGPFTAIVRSLRMLRKRGTETSSLGTLFDCP